MQQKIEFHVTQKYARLFGMPVNCGDSVLLPVGFDYCAPEVLLSEIQRVFVGKSNTSAFEDWTQPLEWNERISQSTLTGDDYLRVLTVIGDKPAPTDTTKEISNGRIIILKKDHVINFTVDEASELNHLFMQSMESGQYVRIWYETAGGLMFGGNGGIYCQLSGNMVLQRGQNNEMQYVYTAKWKAPKTEDRCISPIFDQTQTGVEEFDTTVVVLSTTPVVHELATFTGAEDYVGSDYKFKYTNINPAVGFPISMTIIVDGVEILVVDTTSDFLGAHFSYTDGTDTWAGVFVDGPVNF